MAEINTENRTVTMNDVAKRAGVSRATVSRLLSNAPLPISVTDATRERVFNAVKELGYRPNRIAQSLMTKKTCILGMSMPQFFPPDIEDRRMISMQSTSVGDLVCGVQSVAQPRGYDIQLFMRYEYDRGECPPHGADILDFVEGVVYCTPNPRYDRYTHILDANVPLVMVGPNPAERKVTSVCVDNEETLYRLTKALIGSGFKRIGLILPEDRDTILSRLRYQGYRKAHLEAELPIYPHFIVPGHFGGDAGALLADIILDGGVKPEAIIVGRSDIAGDVLARLKERGLRCPEDISLVVYGNDHSFDFTEPRITAVEIGRFEMAAAAARLLLEEIDGDAEPGREEFIEPLLVRRESCLLDIF